MRRAAARRACGLRLSTAWQRKRSKGGLTGWRCDEHSQKILEDARAVRVVQTQRSSSPIPSNGNAKPHLQPSKTQATAGQLPVSNRMTTPISPRSPRHADVAQSRRSSISLTLPSTIVTVTTRSSRRYCHCSPFSPSVAMRTSRLQLLRLQLLLLSLRCESLRSDV